MKLPLKLLMKTNQEAKLVDVPSARLRRKLQQKLRSQRRAAALSARQPRKPQLRRLIAARRATIHPQMPKKTVVAVAKKMAILQLRNPAISKSLI